MEADKEYNKVKEKGVMNDDFKCSYLVLFVKFYHF